MEEEIKINPTDGALTKGIKMSLNNTALKLKGGWKQSVFTRCFPSLATHHETSLEAIRNSALEPSTKALLLDLSSVVEEELVEPLNRLSALNKSNTNSQDCIMWRPSGSPQRDMQPHDAKVLRCQKKIMQEVLASRRKRRMEQLERVKNGRSKCESNSVSINKVVENLQEIQAVCECVQTKKKKMDLEDFITSEYAQNERKKLRMQNTFT